MLDGIFMNGEDAHLDKETLDEFSYVLPLERICLAFIKGVVSKTTDEYQITKLIDTHFKLDHKRNQRIRNEKKIDKFLHRNTIKSKYM